MKEARLKAGPLRYVEQGNGPVLLLVHGFPLDHTLWSEQMESFAAHHRVIAPDLRGFGQSPLPEPVPERFDMAAYAADLAELLHQLGVAEPISLAGLSMGGYVAFAFWKLYPQRVGRLLLIHTRAGSDPPATVASRQQQAQIALDQGVEPIVEGMLPKLCHPDTATHRPDLENTLRTMMRRSTAAGIAAALRGMAARPDMTAELARIQVPTLVVAGDGDALIKEEQTRAMAEAIPGSRYIVIGHAGHLAPLEQPAAFTAAVADFLARA
ncbi:MAG TPA: alpha/beta fold hydrolase [Gemmatales bacterium]|nr:alpha/beta fold hydrolase [Gemmatales bacterium]HMP58177.1 alpha/beta fold hydrolase [Gemmatales bacterium]